MRTYTVICLACRKVHEFRADFLSASMSVRAADGKLYPVHGCADCIATPGKIKAAYEATISK